MPPFMAFDIDADKPEYCRLFPEYRCDEIHDALDIPRPQVTTINPISGNCQFIYKMFWSLDDWDRFQSKPESVLKEYEEVRQSLSLLLGSDPRFRNHVVRSPMFVAGWHRKNPNRTRSKTRIELGKDSLYHHSIWYEPTVYSLGELKALATDLRSLHVGFLGNEQVLEELKPKSEASATVQDLVTAEHKRPHIDRRAALEIDPTALVVGERNDSLFNYIRYKAYDIAHKFRQRSDSEGILSYLGPIALEFNAKEPIPQSETEVLATVRSVAKFCLSSKFNLTSKRAIQLNDIRWYGHLPAWKEAEELGVSVSTIKRRRSNQKELNTNPYDMDWLTNGDNRVCLGCGNDISMMRRQAKFCSKKCSKSYSRKLQ